MCPGLVCLILQKLLDKCDPQCLTMDTLTKQYSRVSVSVLLLSIDRSQRLPRRRESPSFLARGCLQL